MGSSLFKEKTNLQNNINSSVIEQAKNIMNNIGQVNGIVSILSKKGLNPEKAVRSICKQRGIDVDEFMKSIQGK